MRHAEALALTELVFEDPEPTLNASQPDDHNGAEVASSRRESMYVEIFTRMIRTVRDGERHLFSEEEDQLFQHYDSLSYEAKYLLSRLCLRKTDKWHRAESFHSYTGELGPNLATAMTELCAGFPCDEPDAPSHLQDLELTVDPNPTSRLASEQPMNSVRSRIFPVINRRKSASQKPPQKEVIDLTLDSEEEDAARASPSIPKAVAHSPIATVDDHSGSRSSISSFVEDESFATLEDLLDCLTRAELKELASKFKVKAPSNAKFGMLKASLLSSCSSQTTLQFNRRGTQTKLRIIKTTENKACDITPIYPPTNVTAARVVPQLQTSRERLRELVMSKLAKCIRLREGVFDLLKRVNLVYFRSDEPMMLPSVLASAKKRTYNESYHWTRTTGIWASREELTKFERAAYIASEIDALLSGTLTQHSRFQRVSRESQTPVPTPKTQGSFAKTKTMGDADDGRTENQRWKGFKRVKALFEEVFDEWQSLATQDCPMARIRLGLERFHLGHVLTRIVDKGAHALGLLKEYHYELRVLDALLSQTHWRRGKRGGWYDRKALLLMNYSGKDNKAATEAALQTVRTGLLDPYTHIVWQSKLERRLTRLENKLQIPPEERDSYSVKLVKPKDVEIRGTRVRDRSSFSEFPSLQSDRSTPRPMTPWGHFGASPSKVEVHQIGTEPQAEKWTGKSIWSGKDDQLVNVEELALQHYELLGFKGRHSEGAIMRTLFGLLFWDIIFAPIPGAFETPFQTAPLDIGEDTFFHSRETLMKARLFEIEQGKSLELLGFIEAQHREKRTWCVGVQWDLLESQELFEVIDCMDPKSLSIVCKVFCEDYVGRSSGMPDLFLWHPDKRICRFVEVKGPGDSLQENQKVWLDALTRAGIQVEVCHVIEGDSGSYGRGIQKRREAPSLDEAHPLKPIGSRAKKRPYSRLSTSIVTSSDEEGHNEGTFPTTPERIQVKRVVEVVIVTPNRSSRKRRKIELPEPLDPSNNVSHM